MNVVGWLEARSIESAAVIVNGTRKMVIGVCVRCALKFLPPLLCGVFGLCYACIQPCGMLLCPHSCSMCSGMRICVCVEKCVDLLFLFRDIHTTQAAHEINTRIT